MTEEWHILALIGVAAFAPGLFWLWYFFKKDEIEPEPLSHIRTTFVWGMASVIPAAFMEKLVGLPDFWTLVVSAPVFEELFKFLAVFLTVYNNDEFDEPMDGIVYGATAALGFASVENVIYLLREYRESAGAFALVSVLRSVISVPAHALFSIMWGYALGLAKFEDKAEHGKIIAVGLASAIGLHAAFNFFCTLGPLWIWAMLALVPLMWQAAHRRMRSALARSPHAPPDGAASHMSRPPQPILDADGKERWFENRVLVVLLLFLVCFPAGLYGLVKNTRFSMPEKLTLVLLWLMSTALVIESALT